MMRGHYVLCKNAVKCERQIGLQKSMIGSGRTVFVKPDDATPIKCVWCGEIHDYFQADVREWKLYFTETVTATGKVD